MKRFKKDIIPVLTVWAIPLALILPNATLAFYGDGKFFETAANMLLPFGVYLLAMSLLKNPGKSLWFFFPLAIFAAFQIVVSYMFKDSHPLGIDMFLNLFTTNMTEVGELLGSIIAPILVCVAVYGATIALCVVSIAKRLKTEEPTRKKVRIVSVISIGLGLLCLGICHASIGGYNTMAEIFPLNAVGNAFKAIGRNAELSRYDSTSADFSYGASTAREHDKKELYIAVIGETSRAANWGIFGYERETTPLLSRRGDSLVGFGKTLSESNVTHKSVPMLLSTMSAETYGDSLLRHKSVITAFNEAGFDTYFISNQKRNKSFIEKYGDEAGTTIFVDKQNGGAYDEVVLPYLDSIMANDKSAKKLIVIHTYGSHYNYNDRYPQEKAIFANDRIKQADPRNRENIINAYDNTIAYTDYLLNEIIGRLDTLDYDASLIYCADHGEDIYDDDRQRFLHASPSPTYWQVHVPMLLYMNEAFEKDHPDIAANARTNSEKSVSSSRSFAPTLLQLGGITTSYLKREQSLTDSDYNPSGRFVFLDDSNRAVELEKSGMKENDIKQLNMIINHN